MDIKSKIKEIISQEQYKITQKEKDSLLLPLLKERIKANIEFSPIIKKFYASLGKGLESFEELADIPPIPVSMFKKFELKTVPDEEISRTLHSSATTTGIPSKIFINKETTFNQAKALTTTLKNFLRGNTLDPSCR